MIVNKLEKNICILPSDCDFTGKLGIEGIFNNLMDIATEHAELLNIGFKTLKDQNKYWIVVKNMIKLDYTKLPEIGDMIKLETWPEAAKGIKCIRYYRMLDKDNNVIVSGKTLWTISNILTGRPERVDYVYPEGFVCLTDKAIEDDFSIVNVSEENIVGKYKVQSTDIDAGLHMNNVKYLKALGSLYSVSDKSKGHIKKLEIQYKVPAHEGDDLVFYVDKNDKVLSYKAKLEDKDSVYIQISLE